MKSLTITNVVEAVVVKSDVVEVEEEGVDVVEPVVVDTNQTTVVEVVVVEEEDAHSNAEAEDEAEDMVEETTYVNLFYPFAHFSLF